MPPLDNERPEFLSSQVFVAGGQPTVTYNPRDSVGLERRVREYLAERHRILCLTGPTKSGKTVLIRKVVPRSVRVTGGEIETLDAFWSIIADACGAFTAETYEEQVGRESGANRVLSAGFKPGGVGLGANGESTTSDSSSQRHSQTRRRNVQRVAREELLRADVTVVVDDWHHIALPVQQQIVRSVKDLVFDGVPVVFVAVPHRSADIVRAESEMTGRIDNLRVPPWSKTELEEIASAGFRALNVAVPVETPQRLANESYGSPHLMQRFCRRICQESAITQTLAERGNLPLEVRDKFFRDIAADEDLDATYSRLAHSPLYRSDHLRYTLKSGETRDIYGVLLQALAETGPETEVGSSEIRGALRRVISGEPPTQQECTEALEQMSARARELVRDKTDTVFIGDPVLEFDPQLGRVHIVEPFFALQLRWRIREPVRSARGVTQHLSGTDGSMKQLRAADRDLGATDLPNS